MGKKVQLHLFEYSCSECSMPVGSLISQFEPYFEAVLCDRCTNLKRGEYE